MLILGLILIVIGALLAALLHDGLAQTIGRILIIIGVLLVAVYLILLLADTSDAHASTLLLLPFGPHMARALRWVAYKLDPDKGTSGGYCVPTSFGEYGNGTSSNAKANITYY